MKKTILTAGAVAMTASAASAAGIERTANDYGILFQDGDQANVSISIVNPTISGKYTDEVRGAGRNLGVEGGGKKSSGNMANSYVSVSASYKKDLGENLSFGLFLTDGYGANAAYEEGFYTGLTAEWDSSQISAVLRYGISDRISVYGGPRYVKSSADIAIPGQFFAASAASSAQDAQTAIAALTAAGAPEDHPDLLRAQEGLQRAGAVLAGYAANPDAFNYTAEGEESGDWGYILGAAYEIPDIALRVALTYESSITHEFDTTEVLTGLGVLGAKSKTKVEMPQSVKLDFQTGVAKDTLVFGSVKWTEWSKWEVRTEKYDEITGSEITGFDNDVVTWRLGVGRKFNEQASGFAQVRYEKADGGEASRLAPTDGMLAFGLGGQYTNDNVSMRGGIEYVKLGDAEVADGSKFEGNSAFGFGLSVKVTF